MALATAAAGLAAIGLGAMYLNARLLIGHDLSTGTLAQALGLGLKFIEQRYKEDRMTVTHDFQAHAENPTTANNIFLIFEGQQWTYKQFWDRIRKVSQWLVEDLHVRRHKIVAINGENTPEYIMMWLGIELSGAVPAFINCNLTAAPLEHCIKLCEARYVLVDREIKSLIETSEEELMRRGGPGGRGECKVLYYDSSLIDGLQNAPLEIKNDQRSGLKPDDLATLIYTSGTTGMPKGTKGLRIRALTVARGISWHLGLKPGDRMYTCLPLYHGSGNSLCVLPSIYAASTVILSRRFSHRTFWSEVRESKADIIQYVGELCRYLINAPPSPLDKQHNVKKVWGNGMRKDVWDVFRERFAIESIDELYAATDGMQITFNDNKGDFGKYAIAKRGLLWRLLNGRNEKRVKMDVVTQEILRDADGFAIECQDGEPGEAVHRVDPVLGRLIFAGYYNNEGAGEKRKIQNLFEEGDFWFRSGDMMVQEPDGCVYFVDRLGDTFRWKSENVSTTEVGDILGRFDQIAEANVYGVEVPFADGRCGCAAILLSEGVSEEKLDGSALANHCIRTLPRYAVPIFLRIVKQMEATGTMKTLKGKLREEGIDVNKIAEGPTSDVLFWLPPGQSTYVPFQERDWRELQGGKVRL